MRNLFIYFIIAVISLSLVFNNALSQPEALYQKILELNLLYLENKKPKDEDLNKLAEELKKRGTIDAYISVIEILNNLNLLNKALNIAKDAIEKFSNNDTLYIYYGELLIRNGGNVDEGVHWIKKALTVNPNNRYAYMDLIQIYLNTGKTEEAFKLINEAESKFPNDAFLLFLKGKAYYMIELYRNAETYLEKSVEIDNSNIEALKLLAEIYVINNKLDKASNLYEKLIKSGIISKDMIIKLIKIYIALEKYDRALSIAERMYSVHPDEELKELLALIYLKIDDINKAKEMLKEVTEISPLMLVIMCKENKLDKFKKSLKEYIDSLDSFKTLLFLLNDPKSKNCIDVAVIEGLKKLYKDAEFYHTVSQFYISIDDYKKSELYAKNAISLQEKNGDYWFLLGSIKERKGEFDKVEKYLERALKIKGDDPVILNYYGYTLIATGRNVDKGIELVNKALKLDPDNTSYLDSLAWGYFKKGEIKKALEIQEKVYERESDNAVIVYHLAEIYYKLGRKDEAMKLFKKTRELLPKTKDVSPWERKEIESRLYSLGI